MKSLQLYAYVWYHGDNGTIKGMFDIMVIIAQLKV